MSNGQEKFAILLDKTNAKKDNETHSHLEEVFCTSLVERYANDTFQRPKNILSECGFNCAMYKFFLFCISNNCFCEKYSPTK